MNVGRFVNVVQVTPPSVVSSTAGLPAATPAWPASQQVVAETQSIAFGSQLTVAQPGGVKSAQVIPLSVLSATAGLSAKFTPVAQQTEVEAQESAVTWLNVNGRLP